MKRFALCLALCGLCLGAVPLPGQAAELNAEAKSALLMDVQTGTVLYEQNAHDRLPPASVTKVMTMLLIMEAVDGGRISMSDTVTASEAAAAKGGSQVYLKVGETMPVSDMLKSIAVSSANDCACAMAEFLAGSEEAFVAQMNEKAESLGMADTHFVNCTGLDDGANANEHRTSAYDIALMSRELLKNHPDIRKFTTIWMDTIRGGAFGLSNTNKLIRFYSGATGLKTGFTSGAGYCLSASAQRDGMELIAVVMGCESAQKRSAACKTLLDYGFANYCLYTPELKETPTVPVALGKEKHIALTVGEEACFLIEKAKKGAVACEISTEPTVAAPVAAGQRLGKLTIREGENIISEIPLVADGDVAKLSWGDLFLQGLRRMAMAGG